MTDEEILEVWESADVKRNNYILSFARAIEAKLKREPLRGKRAMTDKARELLERAHQFIWNKDGYDNELGEEIRAYLAEPEVKREALSEETIRWTYEKNLRIVMLTEHGWFNDSVRFAEKHHGIGGGE